jgi:hypothetical protein
MKPAEQLIELAKLYEERNKEYGDSYKEAGAILQALFPNGIELETKHRFNKFCIIVHIVTKLSRYCNNFYIEASPDHLEDIAVYATMLLELDGEKECP